MFTGNRGVIHDPKTRELLKIRWSTNGWIVCSCEWKGRQRVPMGRNSPSGSAGWTELFFLDEVTALAAGHRPCFSCRRDAAIAFRDAFAKGISSPGIKASEIDAILHQERWLSSSKKPNILNSDEISMLPDGVMMTIAGGAYAVKGGKLLLWNFEGYRTAPKPRGTINLLTPHSTIAALRNGFLPVWHSSALKVCP